MFFYFGVMIASWQCCFQTKALGAAWPFAAIVGTVGSIWVIHLAFGCHGQER